MKLKYLFVYMSSLLSAISLNTSAFESTGAREILSYGCHRADNTCYVQISGNPVGPEECQSTSVRWNEKLDANGKAVLSIIQAAFYADKKVSFNISSSCYSQQTNFPTMSYLNVHKD